MEQLKKLIKSYESWVAANPETVCDLETTSKWASYFIAGRISDSNIVSELVYSLSNLMVLYHDRIIERASHSLSKSNVFHDAPGTSRVIRNRLRGGGNNNINVFDTTNDSINTSEKLCYRLKVMLTTLEYCEVFIEISAKRVFGSRGKWFFIVLLQFAKAASRFFIFKHSTGQIITSPAMPSLNRRPLIKQQKLNKTGNGGCAVNGTVATATESNSSNTKIEEHSFTFQLKRSGRVVRKVEGAPPLQYRDFKLLAGGGGGGVEENNAQSVITNMGLPLMQAEYLYIAKPLIHLAAMGLFGEKRWKQYFVALALDFASIRIYHKNRHMMNKQQRLEMSRRCVQLLLYMMRSPFYERFTQPRLDRIINFVANNVPLLRLIAGPLREYVPHWQNTYFYLWST